MAALDPATIEGVESLRARYAERTRTICNDCGTNADLPKTVIAAFPRPWRQHVDGRVLCADCWSSAAASETALTPMQARIIARQALGFDWSVIAASLGIEEATIQETSEAIDGLRGECDEATNRLLDAL